MQIYRKIQNYGISKETALIFVAAAVGNFRMSVPSQTIRGSALRKPVVQTRLGETASNPMTATRTTKWPMFGAVVPQTPL